MHFVHNVYFAYNFSDYFENEKEMKMKKLVFYCKWLFDYNNNKIEKY